MKREIICAIAGFVGGAAVTALAGYFGVVRRYIPLNRLEDEVGRLEEERQSKLRKLNLMDKEYQQRHQEYEEKLEEYDKRLDAYDNDIQAAQLELRQIQESIGEHEDAPEEEGQTTFLEISDQYGSRWNGPLSEEELEEYNSRSELERLSYLDEIRESRFDHSMDVEHMIYRIDMDEHNDRPAFIDEHILTYYEGDDVLADGRKVVQNVADLVDPKFFRYFNKTTNEICFRNDSLKIDYVIERSEGTYQNAAFGIGDENAYIPEHKINQERAKEDA